MKSRKLVVLSADRIDRVKIVLNCCERLLIIGFVSMAVINCIHNSQYKNALKSIDRDQDRDYTSNLRAFPLIVDSLSERLRPPIWPFS
jgi:hypothetical protein